jgi:hypothetical protein
VHVEILLGAKFFHQRKIADSSAAETKIVTDQHKSGKQFLMQSPDKICCAHLRKTRIKPAYLHPVYTQRVKKFQLFTQAGQPRRCLLRGKKFTRMRLENHHRRLQVARLRRPAQFAQQGLMA